MSAVSPTCGAARPLLAAVAATAEDRNGLLDTGELFLCTWRPSGTTAEDRNYMWADANGGAGPRGGRRLRRPRIETTTSNTLTLQPEIRWPTGLPVAVRGGTGEREAVFRRLQGCGGSGLLPAHELPFLPVSHGSVARPAQGLDHGWHSRCLHPPDTLRISPVNSSRVVGPARLVITTALAAWDDGRRAPARRARTGGSGSTWESSWR